MKGPEPDHLDGSGPKPAKPKPKPEAKEKAPLSSRCMACIYTVGKNKKAVYIILLY